MKYRPYPLACALVLASLGAHADIETGVRHFQALNYEAAQAALEPLCGRDGLACWYLGLIHDPVTHRPSPGRYYQTEWLDRDLAIAYFERAIELNEPYAFHSLALLYSDPEIKHRVVNPGWMAENLRMRAMEPLEELVVAGDGVAAYMLADFRRTEIDNDRHADTAHRLLLEEAMQGRPLSQLFLARAYDSGLLVRHIGRSGNDRDAIHAFAWYTVAAMHGEEHARRWQAVSATKLKKRHFDEAEQLTSRLVQQIAAAQRSP